MYEQMTYETIMTRMLARIKAVSNLDITEGSILYHAIAPEAFELAQAYMAISEVYEYTFADTAPREELIRRAKERGLSPSQATNAVFKGRIDGDLEIGHRFSYNDLSYTVTELLDDDYCLLECSTAGLAGNRYIGTLTATDYVQGMTSAELVELLVPGTNEEETEAFRERYFASFHNQSFGGNRADYKEKLLAIQGVGGCKVKRVSKDDDTVRVQIINSLFEVPAQELIDRVQKVIDPELGEGDGLAPIGHKVAVSGVEGVNVDLAFTLTLDGYNYADLKSNVENAIDDYFLTMRKSWADSDAVTLRIAQIEAKILSVSGVLDITGTTLNGTSANITLLGHEIPIRGGIHVS